MHPVLIAAFGMMAVIMTAAASYILMPVEDELFQRNANLTGRAQEVSIVQHEVAVITPPVLVGAIFLSLFLQAVRRQQDEVYE